MSSFAWEGRQIFELFNLDKLPAQIQNIFAPCILRRNNGVKYCIPNKKNFRCALPGAASFDMDIVAFDG
jgi:hypothetical protein